MKVVRNHPIPGPAHTILDSDVLSVAQVFYDDGSSVPMRAYSLKVGPIFWYRFVGVVVYDVTGKDGDIHLIVIPFHRVLHLQLTNVVMEAE